MIVDIAFFVTITTFFGGQLGLMDKSVLAAAFKADSWQN